MPWNGFNDHAARAILPLLHLGSIAAAYTLGMKLFTRRVGLFIAAIWALYPHMGDWSRVGDLDSYNAHFKDGRFFEMTQSLR